MDLLVCLSPKKMYHRLIFIDIFLVDYFLFKKYAILILSGIRHNREGRIRDQAPARYGAPVAPQTTRIASEHWGRSTP